MKPKTKLQRWIPVFAAGLVLLGSNCLGHAAGSIVYDFASGLEGWAGNEPAGMSATYTWNATGGSSGGGCMQVVFDGTTTTEMDPIVTLPAPLNEQQYLSVSIHMKVDPSSGTTGTGGYGNLQAVLRNASYSWDSIWYGGLHSPLANGWVTYTFVISQPYQPAEQYLQFQFQGSAGYTAPVTVYIDNVTITPVPNPWVVDSFTNDTSSGYSEENWTGISETSSLSTSQDAGGGATPAGALQMDIGFPVAAQWAAWGQSWVLRTQPFDPSRFTYFECDVKVDTANSTPFSDGSYGALTIGVRDGAYGGPYNCSPNGIALTASYANWTHLKLALPTGSSLTNSVGYDIEVSGNYMGPVRLYFDNISLSSPVTKPPIFGLMPGTAGGAKIAVDADGTANQYDQEGISSPAADNNAKNFFWINQVPASYSFTITNFPSPAAAPGFDAHVYLVNGDTITSGSTGSWAYNQTYSGVPYNAYDYAGLRIQNSTNNSGVVAIFEWKTNSPSSNATNTSRFALSQFASANGTWTLNFSDNLHGSILGPDGSMVGSFTLPDFSSDPNYTGNFNPGTSMVQFGLAKNDAQNTGVNNGQSATFTHVAVTNMNGTIYDDSFTGPGLAAKYAWQVAEYYQDAANRVTWSPYGTAWWLKWGVPSLGYTVQSAASLSGPWGDAGVSYSYADSTGTNYYGAIPASSLPAGNAAFFRLTNPNP